MCLANFGLIYSYTEVNKNSQTPAPGPSTVSQGVQSDVMARSLSVLLQNFPFSGSYFSLNLFQRHHSSS